MKLVPTKPEARARKAERAVEEIKAQAEEWVEQTRQGFVEARSKLDQELESARESIAQLEQALESERRQRADLERRLEEVPEPPPAPRPTGEAKATRMDRPAKWAAARKLAAEGYSQREIAQRLDINRRTVARLIAADAPPRYRRAPQGSMLDPLEPVMRTVLSERPGIDAPGMTEVLREHGYRGSVDLVRRRLRSLRASG
jgi:transposase